MKNHIQSRNVKYGTISITLTALAIVAVLVFNVIIVFLEFAHLKGQVSVAAVKRAKRKRHSFLGAKIVLAKHCIIPRFRC